MRARAGSKITFDQPPGLWIFWGILNQWCFVIVCPRLLCLSPPIMSVPSFYVRPHLLCLSPPIIFFADKPFLDLECGTSNPACLFSICMHSFLLHQCSLLQGNFFIEKRYTKNKTFCLKEALKGNG